jgi:hypothetical protein
MMNEPVGCFGELVTSLFPLPLTGEPSEHRQRGEGRLGRVERADGGPSTEHVLLGDT